jgi:orotate phosphoribosyltransferase
MENEVISIMKRTGAIMLNGHFVGTSGRHLEGYVNKDRLFPHTAESSRIGELFAEKCQDLDIDVVAAPAMGGVILSQWTAFHLSHLKGKEILGVYAEKKDDALMFTRGYDETVRGKKVLVIEDVVTTGGSLKKVIDAVKQNGGIPVAASVMINKDPDSVTEATFGVPFYPLTELRINSYDESECPLCKNNVPVNTSIGHGKKFVEKNNV